jgi:hypothetical protein
MNHEPLSIVKTKIVWGIERIVREACHGFRGIGCLKETSCGVRFLKEAYNFFLL